MNNINNDDNVTTAAAAVLYTAHAATQQVHCLSFSLRYVRVLLYVLVQVRVH